MTQSELGHYLRSRRALVTAAEAGLPVTGPRRVPGLRREEVAVLAGVSADYYGRLEQGRERHPSAQVLDALAGALRLDRAGRQHLYHLTGTAVRPEPEVGAPTVDPSRQRLVDSWHQPARVYNRALDLLAHNAMARALFGPGEAPGNLVERLFLDPVCRDFFVDWDTVAAGTVGSLRLHHGAAPHDVRLQEVLADMLARSADFRALWRRHDVRETCPGRKNVRHPEVGEIALVGHTFDVRGTPSHSLVV